MPTSLNQTLHELAAALEQQNTEWRRVRIALEHADPEARIAIAPELMAEIEDLTRPRAPLAPRHGALRA